MNVAAIFDIDGTLLPGPTTEARFISYLVRRKVLGLKDLVTLPVRWGRLAAQCRSIRATSRAYLANQETARVKDGVDEFFRRAIAPHLWRKALLRLQAHASQSDLIILLSGTLDLLLPSFQAWLEAQVGVGTRLEEIAGRFSGRVVGRNVSGIEKARRLIELQTIYDIDLKRSFAYGNHDSDRYFLQMVGHPVAVNPDRKLAARALAKNWMIESWA